MYENQGISETQTIKNSLRTMNSTSFGSREYERARKSFAWVCNRIRSRDKSDAENFTKRNRLGRNTEKERLVNGITASGGSVSNGTAIIREEKLERYLDDFLASITLEQKYKAALCLGLLVPDEMKSWLYELRVRRENN